MRHGSIVRASSAARVSRETVHRWLRADPTFRREFEQCKRRRIDEEFQSLDACLSLFTQVVRPILPSSLWPKVSAELHIAVVNLKHDLNGGRRRRAILPSGETVESSVPLEGPSDVAVGGRGKGHSTGQFSG
jgi:hypothetical protein